MTRGASTSDPKVKIRLGIPACFGRFSDAAGRIDAPILVSANGFWRNSRFHYPSPRLFNTADVALDSAGFIAMIRYGGYRWTVDEYVGLAASYPWAWWSAMDYCCEREVAGDRAEVTRRVDMTVAMLARCRAAAEGHGVMAPMPVLQGRHPEDYLRCAAMMGPLPQLVGIGSVCRRHLAGPDGLLTIIAALDGHLPKHIRFHLFGVKGAALGALAGHPRVASIDSMAWDRAARWEASKSGASCTVDHRIGHLRRWYREQRERLGLFGAAA